MFAITTDMWTDNIKQRAYLTITLHYLDEEWSLISYILSTKEFPDQQKTGFNIRRQLVSILTEFKIPIHRCVITTDRGSNMISAFKNDIRLDCAAHILNTIVTTGLDKADPVISDLIDNCKALVKYMKKASLQDKLVKTVKQSCDTRWNSIYTMLQSIEESYTNIMEVLVAHSPDNLLKLTSLDRDMIQQLLLFLKVSTRLNQYHYKFAKFYGHLQNKAFDQFLNNIIWYL